MININTFDFDKQISPADATVGVVGYGYVGQAVAHFFREANFNVIGFDKNKKEFPAGGANSVSFAKVVSDSELIFVCVPTPMGKDGSCHTKIVEDVISGILFEADFAQRPANEFIIVIKSTVRPGFTKSMKEKFPGARIVFSPEFLTEKNSIADFKNTDRIVVGGSEKDCEIVCNYFYGCIPEKVLDEETSLVMTDETTAEMVKLYTNGILMTKILFSNEIYQVCQKLGLNYEEVRSIACLDSRIGDSHTSVPGHDGQLGAGGHCFPKDINNLRAVCREFGVPEKIFSAVIQRNDELREDKDWLRMKDRAVIDA